MTKLLVIFVFFAGLASVMAQDDFSEQAIMSQQGGLVQINSGGGSSGPSPILQYSRFPTTGTAGTVTDQSSSGNNATATASPSYVSGLNGNGAISFNGTSQYIKSGNMSITSSSYTLTGWVSGNSGSWCIELDAASGEDFQAEYITTGSFWINKSGSDQQVITSSLPSASGAGSAIFFALVVTPSATTLYLNGSSTAAGSCDPPSFTVGYPNGPLYLGQAPSPPGFGADTFQDVRLYNLALTTSQESAIYSAGAQ